MDQLYPQVRPVQNWEQVQERIKQLADNDVGAALRELRALEIFYCQQQHIAYSQWNMLEESKAVRDAIDEADERLHIIGNMFKTYLAKRQLLIFENQDRANLEASLPPSLGERLLLLILTKEDRVNIPGDLEEEFKQIAVKHGERFAKVWYYKQVAASAWPMARKAVKWWLLASVGAWLKRYI